MSYLYTQLAESAEIKKSFSDEDISIAEKYLEEGSRILHNSQEWEAINPILIYNRYGSIRLWGDTWVKHNKDGSTTSSSKGYFEILSSKKRWMKAKFATPIVKTKEQMKITI